MDKSTLNLIITSIVALVSACIGGGLTIAGNQLKSWIDERRERTRTLRAALFKQLEIYKEAIRLSPKAHESLSNALEGILANAGAPENAIREAAVFRPYLATLMKQFLTTDIQDLANRYEEIVEQVAQVDALLAGRINQRFHISRMTKLDAFFGPVDFSVPPPSSGLGVFRTEMMNSHHAEFIRSIERSVLETASLLGSRVFSQSKKGLKRARRSFLKTDSNELRRIIGPFLASLGHELEKSIASADSLHIPRVEEET